MISRQGQRARRCTDPRRAGSRLAPACMLLTLLIGALAAPAASASPASDTRSPESNRRADACALTVGPAKDYCLREPHTVTAPQLATADSGAWLLVPLDAALLALVTVRRAGRPELP